MAYATVEDVESRLQRRISDNELEACVSLLNDAAVIIDATGTKADSGVKKVVSCRMVMRALGDGSAGSGVPMGASQGSVSALGYTQSWTMGTGAAGELYLAKLEKQLLGLNDHIGCRSPLEAYAEEVSGT